MPSIMSSKPKPAFKLWLETDKGYVFGPGLYNLLKSIEEKGTLKEAAQSLEMSYRYAWGLIHEAEERLGDSLIKASKGGRDGGGSTEITDLGREFIEDFHALQSVLARASMKSPFVSSNNVTGIVKNITYEKKGIILTLQIGEVNVRFDRKDLDLDIGDKPKLRLIIEQQDFPPEG